MPRRRMPLPVECEHCCHPIEGIAYGAPDAGDEDAAWVRLCHPDGHDAGLPHCYRNVMWNGHPARRCRDCIDARTHADAGDLPARQGGT